MSEHPYDCLVSALRSHGCRILPKRDSQGRDAVRATCPAHHDRNPSLVVTRDGETALVKDFGGCSTTKVVGALSLTMADLFSGPRRVPVAPTIVASYDYVDLNGVLVAQKVRRSDKSFRWRVPALFTAREWKWGLHGSSVGLYRLPELAGASTVYLSEGEKAVDCLWALGLPATCGPNGAGSWSSAWADDLWNQGCRSLVIFADRDAAGAQHAERVAASCDGLGIEVRVVDLPGLAHHADVFDWIAAGHSVEDVLAVVAETPAWTPERVAAERLAHSRTRKR
ncbi:MAG: toprim domain-containing protein [Acidobacteriota bacterium]|nr:toprim domain-containing protein [Acidobacteriota bacterium]